MVNAEIWKLRRACAQRMATADFTKDVDNPCGGCGRPRARIPKPLDGVEVALVCVGCMRVTATLTASINMISVTLRVGKNEGETA